MHQQNPNSVIDSPTLLMQPIEAIKIIQKLINGINPLIDEPLADNDLYLHSDIQRAFEAAIPALARKQKWLDKQQMLPNKTGQPWCNDEDIELSESFDDGLDIDQLSDKHGRTKGAIKSRLVKLGKIES